MDYLIIICLLLIFTGVKPSEEVKTTVYHIRGLTASGEHTDKIKEPFIAVSRDLLKAYPMHSKVRLFNCPHEGEYLVKDKMNKRFTNKVDVFIKMRKKKYDPCICMIQIISSPQDSITSDPILPSIGDSLNLKEIKVDTAKQDTVEVKNN